MNESLPEVMSCGFLIFQHPTDPEFLLMEHVDRLDLPKGHVDAGETPMQCALRELAEETGITSAHFEVDERFRYETSYRVQYKRKFGGGTAMKTLVIFLGWLTSDVEIEVTEHEGFRWMRWSPPHHVQEMTIDPLLAKVAQHFHQHPPRSKNWGR